MSIFRKMKQKIKGLPKGAVITLEDFSELQNREAVALYLSRLKREGVIERLGRSKYYVPKKTKFGILGPSEFSVMKVLFKEDSSSYISGTMAYNKLGLTTQIPNEITIVGNRYNRRSRIGNIKVKYMKRKTPVCKNVLILQILDAINDIKKIPNTTTNEVAKILKNKIQKLSLNEKKQMIDLSKYYRPFVRAIVGEILDEVKVREVRKLRSVMNPLTVFKIGVSEEIFPLKKAWNLV